MRGLLNSIIRFLEYNESIQLLAKFERFNDLPDVKLSVIEGRLNFNDFDGAIVALNSINDNYKYKYKAYRAIAVWLSENNRFKELNKYMKKIDRRKSKNELFVLEKILSYNYARFYGVKEAAIKYPDHVCAAICSIIADNNVNEIIDYTKSFLTEYPHHFEEILFHLFEYNIYKLTDIERLAGVRNIKVSQQIKKILIPILDELLILYEDTDYIELGFNRRYIFDSYWRLGMKYILIEETEKLPRIYKLLKGSKNKTRLKKEAEKIVSNFFTRR